MSVEIISVPRALLPRSDVLGIDTSTTATVADGTASSALPGGLYRVVAIGGDFRILSGPTVANGTNGLRLIENQPEVFYIEDGHKIGVSAV